MTNDEEVPLLHAEQAREPTLCMALTLRITYLFIPDVRLPQHLGLFARRSVG
jgi:hypothetical protein